MNQRKAIHDRVLNAASTEELMAAYGDWADKYDRDLMGEMGYVAPMITSALLLETLPDKGARILDAGCGTGLVGQLLYNKGCRNIDGLDYSPEMLAKAKEKKVYQNLDRQDLTQSLDMEDNVYDAVISVGTFTKGLGCAVLAKTSGVTLSRTTASTSASFGQRSRRKTGAPLASSAIGSRSISMVTRPASAKATTSAGEQR